MRKAILGERFLHSQSLHSFWDPRHKGQKGVSGEGRRGSWEAGLGQPLCFPCRPRGGDLMERTEMPCFTYTITAAELLPWESTGKNCTRCMLRGDLWSAAPRPRACAQLPFQPAPSGCQPAACAVLGSDISGKQKVRQALGHQTALSKVSTSG